jgi:hypothetical protein
MKTSNQLFSQKFFLLLLSALWAPTLSEAAPLNQISPTRNPFKSLMPIIVQPQEPVPDTRRQQATRATTALPAQVQQIPQLTVTGLVWNSDRPQAIVNGQVANQGDTILGVKIVRIHKRGIDVAFEGATTTIKP